MPKSHRSLLVLLFVQTLSACASPFKDLPDTKAVMPSANPESYKVGDAFFYDDGYVESVTRTSGKRVFWQARGGQKTYTSFVNIFLPQIAWHSNKSRGEVESYVSSNALWPLKEGKSIRFSATQKLHKSSRPQHRRSEQDWRCHVEGKKLVTLSFDQLPAWEVRCSQYRASGGDLLLERRWLYSPKIGHYVVQEDIYHSRAGIKRYRRELVDYMRTEDFTRGKKDAESAEAHLQLVLSKQRKGEVSHWLSDDMRRTRSILPLQTLRLSNGRYCRKFKATYKYDKGEKNLKAVACRKGEKWHLALLDRVQVKS